MRDAEFQQKWAGLLKRCPWGTAFQSYGFVDTWYRAYREQYEPAIAYQISPDGGLLGLLSLAVRRDNGNWVVAGDHQAEYRMWLARPHNGDLFITGALTRLSKEYNIDQLQFSYVQANAPLNWAFSEPWRRFCLLKPQSRPILDLKDANQIRKSLKKKSNKSRFNRLKRLGPIQFERVTEKSQLSKIMPDLEVMYDFRLGAVYGLRDFQTDKFKRDFHLALMDVPGLLHVTILKVGNNIIAFHIGVCDENTVYNCILSYSPFESRQSPGKLHILLLAKDLAESNFTRFDLTPGHDPWKERFANDHEIAYKVTVYSKAWKCRLGHLKQAAVGLAWDLLRLLRVKARDVWLVSKAFASCPLRNVALSLLRRMRYDKKDFIYSIMADKVVHISGGRQLNKDCLKDFLAERPDTFCEPLDGFLTDALERIESGQHPYTAVIDGRLAFCCWLVEIAKHGNRMAVHLHIMSPLKSAKIRDFNAVAVAASVDFLEASIAQMIHEAALIPAVEEILVFIPQNNLPLIKVIEKMTLKYAGILRRVSEEELAP